MKLNEIIEANEREQSFIEWGQISPYKKLLYYYYKNLFMSEPVVMVDSITNNSCYVRIISQDDFSEVVCEDDNDSEDQASYKETVNFNSKMFSDLLQ